MATQAEFKQQTSTYTGKPSGVVDNKREAERLFRHKNRQLTTITPLQQAEAKEEGKKRDIKAKEKGIVVKKESKNKRAKH